MNGSTVSIDIRDYRKGIPDEIKENVLQPFFTTKKGTAGTGLGLSITNDIVKAYGGKLEVESTRSKGTILTIHLQKRGKHVTRKKEEQLRGVKARKRKTPGTGR